MSPNRTSYSKEGNFKCPQHFCADCGKTSTNLGPRTLFKVLYDVCSIVVMSGGGQCKDKPEGGIYHHYSLAVLFCCVCFRCRAFDSTVHTRQCLHLYTGWLVQCLVPCLQPCSSFGTCPLVDFVPQPLSTHPPLHVCTCRC